MKQIAILIICLGLAKLIFGYPAPEPTMGHLLPLVETVLALAGTATGSYTRPYYSGALNYGGAPYYSGTPCYGSGNLAGYGPGNLPGYGSGNLAGYGSGNLPGYGTPCYGLQYG